jgi:hypothetical protein
LEEIKRGDTGIFNFFLYGAVVGVFFFSQDPTYVVSVKYLRPSATLAWI